MDSTTVLILDYSLVQWVVLWLWKKGLWHFLDKLLTQGVKITSMSTDNHTGVAS